MIECRTWTRAAPQLLLVLCAVIAIWSVARADENDVLKSILDDAVADGWIYDDIDAGLATAKKTGKPLLVAFR